VFETDVVQRAVLGQQAFVQALLDEDHAPTDAALSDRYMALYHHAQLRGDVPSGPFGDADLRKQVRVLQQWLANYRELRLEGPPSVVELGGAFGPSHIPADRHPAVELDLGDARAVRPPLRGEEARPQPGTLDRGDRGIPVSVRETPFLSASRPADISCVG